MTDPRFDHAVILILQHDKEGALGIVINRPLGQRPMADLLGDSAVTGNVQVFVGGPVEPNVGFIVHSADYHRAATLDVDGRVAMTANREVLRDIADKKGPAKVLIAFGYAGWASGQLEAEMAHNVWYTAPENPALVFDDDRDKVWEHATARRTQDFDRRQYRSAATADAGGKGRRVKYWIDTEFIAILTDRPHQHRSRRRGRPRVLCREQ